MLESCRVEEALVFVFLEGAVIGSNLEANCFLPVVNLNEDLLLWLVFWLAGSSFRPSCLRSIELPNSTCGVARALGAVGSDDPAERGRPRVTSSSNGSGLAGTAAGLS